MGRLRPGLGVVAAGLCTMGLAWGAARVIGRTGDHPGAGLVVGLAVLITGGVLAGAVLRPKVLEVCVVAAVLTVGAWISWQPSGEAGPRERSMDWSAAAGVVLTGSVPAALWGLAAALTRQSRPDG